MYVIEIPKLSASCLFNAMKGHSRASKHIPWFINKATEYDKLLIMTSEVESRKFSKPREGGINVISYCMSCDQPVTSHSLSFALMKSSLNILLNISFCIPRRKNLYKMLTPKYKAHMVMIVLRFFGEILGAKSSLVNWNLHKKSCLWETVLPQAVSRQCWESNQITSIWARFQPLSSCNAFKTTTDKILLYY